MVIDMKETMWNVLCVEKAEHSYTAKLPADTLALILNTGNYPHPYEGENEKDFLWLGKSTWKFETSFDLSKENLSQKEITLMLERVDTIADVFINGTLIGKCENSFSRYTFNIKNVAKEGSNELGLVIYGAETEAYKKAEKLTYAIPHSVYPVQSMHCNLIRKAQCHAGWDWGPSLMVSGIYKIPKIVCGNGVTIEGVIPRFTPLNDIKKEGSDWNLELDIHFSNIREEDITIEEVNILINELNISSTLQDVKLAKGKDLVTVSIDVKNAMPWYPSGYGEQNLYEISVRASGTGDEDWKSKLGFRTMLGRSLADEWGKSLVFSVNGTDIFCKGGNWIPMDAMPSLETEERYRYLLTSMVDANMNMVRIWGGGQYERDDFYAICDELGLLIWHDFMFACAMYPADEDFLRIVEGEVDFQLKRLSHHASIALWCGNNEDVGALNWFEETKKSPLQYVVNYDRLNEGVVGKAVKKLDKDRLWWSSSPCAGENDYSDSWHDDTKGDMHNWMVWHEGKPFESYLDVKPRFCSEFGFQSFPSLSSVHSYANKDEINPTAPTMLYHQRNPRGNQIIIENIARYFRFPFKGVEDFLYLSQVQQAWAIKYAVDAWRSSRPICMGTLYWQINDNWPVASWSSIEYSGHWKLLQYEAKRFYQMLYGSLYVKGDKVLGFIINDHAKSLDVDVKITRMNFDGSIVDEKVSTISVGAGTSVSCLDLDIADCNKYNEFMLLQWKKKGEKDYSQECRSFAWLSLPRESAIQGANVRHTIEKVGEELHIVLESDKPAFYTVLDINDEEDTKLFSKRKNRQTRERLSDNNVLLLAGEKYTIRYMGEKTKDEIEKALSVKTLRDTY